MKLIFTLNFLLIFSGILSFTYASNISDQVSQGVKRYTFDNKLYGVRNDLNKRQNEQEGEVEKKDLSCGSEFISTLGSCINSDGKSEYDCISKLAFDEFKAYLECINTSVTNYGDLIYYLVYSSLDKSLTSLDEYITTIYDKLMYVIKKTYVPYTTDKFLETMSESYNKNNEETTLNMASNYYGCLSLVENKKYSLQDVSTCLCSIGYGKDIRLYAFYVSFGVKEADFNTVCDPVKASSSLVQNENSFITELSDGDFIDYLKSYNVLNYGDLFNKMVKNELNSSKITLGNSVYKLYSSINSSSTELSNDDETSLEFKRCLVQVNSGIRGNSHLSYCLCQAGFNSNTILNKLYNDYNVSEDTFSDICKPILKNVKKVNKCSSDIGKSVKSCVDEYVPSSLKSNYTECLNLGITDYSKQMKCICDIEKAQWNNNGFLTCYGFNELSYKIECRKFYPNQLFSDNSARGIENYNKEDYYNLCGDVGTGGGSSVYDTCVCRAKEELNIVSLELNDICERIGTEDCSDGIISKRFSFKLLLFVTVLSLFLII